MVLDARNKTLAIGLNTMDYIVFGSGKRNLILIPGLGDGLRTVKGTAAAVSWMYRKLAKDHTVYMFSRINELTEGYTIRKMAEDLAEALRQLELGASDVVGVSQGGMIAQWLAIDHPELVRRLVLTVTSARANPVIEDNIQRWISFAEQDDYKSLMIDTAEKTYTEAYLKKVRKAYPLLVKMGKPKNFSRFLIQSRSILEHDAYDRLADISAPTLVIGAEEDRTVPSESSREISERIPRNILYMYESYGHGVYEEAPDWQERVVSFFSWEKEPAGS